MKLPRQIPPKRLIAALEKCGFQRFKAKGSHVRLKHPDGRWTQVAVHPGPIPQGTLRKILRQAEIAREELKERL